MTVKWFWWYTLSMTNIKAAAPGLAALTPEEVRVELGRYGMMLDAADSRRLVLSPRLYREAAVRAKTMIQSQLESFECMAVCSEYPSLTELHNGLLFERQVQLGMVSVPVNVNWLQEARS
ncbi:hypothetical protein [Variovorax sp. WDL1]|uniref:hypothetical protein n=1 Tax=Variovorax sp. WDL1 TaxID=207745 RepID=UPI0008391443|nr:hypothetical protein [Variovorax sp. WDL1]